MPAAAHVWFASIRRPPATVDELRALLSEPELARLERYRRPRDRRRFAVGRGVLRLLLGAYTGRGPRGLRLVGGPHDKPRLDPHEIGFSISYSHDLVAVAIGPEPIGIDVERVDPGFPWELVAPGASFRAWTRMEATFKAGSQRVTLVDVSPAPDYIATVATTSPVRIRGWVQA